MKAVLLGIFLLFAFETNAHLHLPDQTDSIVFEIQMPGKTTVGFNVYDNLLKNFFLDFSNTKTESATITRKIPRHFSNSVVFYAFFDREKGMGVITYQYFLIDSLDKVLKFSFSENRLTLINDKYSVPLSIIPEHYERLLARIDKTENVETLKADLQNAFDKYSRQYRGTIIGELNDYYYYYLRQKIDPLNVDSQRFIEQITMPIGGELFRKFIYDYVRNRADKFDNNQVPTSQQAQLTNLISLGVIVFLEHENHRGDESFNGMKKWLKGTDIFKKNSTELLDRIQPLNSDLFKEKLVMIQLLDREFKPVDVSSLLKKQDANLVLIDFWATWCKPCIEGMNLISTMRLPSDVVVINISLDKHTSRQKWAKSPVNQNRHHTYLLDQDELANKQFLEYIKLQAIPRYVLVDRSGNLINESFYAPHEYAFLEKLNSLSKGK